MKSAAISSTRNVTVLLGDRCCGDPNALNQLLPLIYAELRRIAARQLRNERAGHTLQPTALVHEVYLRLVDQHQVDWQNRAHFFGVAAQVMRRILVDHARRHGASKRGHGVTHVSIDQARDTAAPSVIPILALDAALLRLEALDPDLAEIVELRAFGGRRSRPCSQNIPLDREARVAYGESVAESRTRSRGALVIPISGDRWQQAKALFEAAVERPAAERGRGLPCSR